MQLLFQEFHNKLLEFMNEMKYSPIKIMIRLIFYGSLIAIFVWIIYNQYFLILFFILLLIIIAEGAHYLRKSREKEMVEKTTERNIKKKMERKPVNEDLLTR